MPSTVVSVLYANLPMNHEDCIIVSKSFVKSGVLS